MPNHWRIGCITKGSGKCLREALRTAAEDSSQVTRYLRCVNPGSTPKEAQFRRVLVSPPAELVSRAHLAGVATEILDMMSTLDFHVAASGGASVGEKMNYKLQALCCHWSHQGKGLTCAGERLGGQFIMICWLETLISILPPSRRHYTRGYAHMCLYESRISKEHHQLRLVLKHVLPGPKIADITKLRPAWCYSFRWKGGYGYAIVAQYQGSACFRRDFQD